MKIKTYLCLAGAFASLYGLSGCNEEESSGAPTPAAADTTTPVGVVNNYAFYLTPSYDSSVPYWFHLYSDFTKDCRVKYYPSSDPQGQTPDSFEASNDAYCILDVEELDLFFNSLSLNYNAPAGACKYVRLQNYGYYKYAPSPKVYDGSSFTLNVATLDGVITSVSGSGADAAQFTFNALTGEVYCGSNYSSQGGPNCCEGIYTRTDTSSTTMDAGPPAVVTTAPPVSYPVDLGGQQANCLGGPVATGTRDRHGWPMVKYIKADTTGVNASEKYESPISLRLNSDLYLANYVYNTATPLVAPVPGTYTFPKAIQPPAASFKSYKGTGSALPSYPYYELLCLDGAEDVRARIRIAVRAWDKVSAFTAKVNPYTAGNPPETNWPGEPYHDRSVWADVLLGDAPASVPANDWASYWE